MKISNSNLSIGLTLIMFLFSGCKNEIPVSSNICVLIDVTDEKFQNQNFISENIPAFLQLMKLDKETGGFSGGVIKFSLINEISDSKSKTVTLEKGDPGLMGENPLIRKDNVLQFYTDLENSFLAILKSAEWGTDASKIYQKVTRELIKTKKEEADQKFLIIYSDMLENSNLFSFYSTGWNTDIQKMIENPEQTLDFLSKNGPVLPDLSEFEIYIIPHRTPENDEKINLSERLWTTLFEHQGATVHYNSVLEIVD